MRTVVAFLVAVLAAAHVSGQHPAVWRLTPDLRIGPEERGQHGEFTRIIAILPTASSTAIADAAAHEIRLFDPTGEYKLKIGREGLGPGEFQGITAAGLLGDTLWVVDAIQRRATLFLLDGKLVRTIAATSSSAALTGLLAGGFGYGWTGAEFRPRQATPITLTTRTGEIIDTLAWVASANARILITLPGGSFIMGRQSFSDGGLTVATPDGRLLFFVDRSAAKQTNGALFRVLSLKPNGDTLWNRTYSYTPRAFDKARGDSLLNDLTRRFTRAGATPEQTRSAIFIPDYYTPVSGAIAASDSSLWLRREEGATVDHWVLDARGQFIAKVTVPGRVTLMAVSRSHAWGVETDEVDVPTVVRYRIDR